MQVMQLKLDVMNYNRKVYVCRNERERERERVCIFENILIVIYLFILYIR